MTASGAGPALPVSDGWEAGVALTPRLVALKALSDPLPGRLHEAAGPQIHRLARDVAPARDVVQLGAGAGKLAVWLAGAVADRGRGRYVAVDAWPAPDAIGVLGRVLAEAGAAGVTEARRGTPAEIGLAWDGGIGIGLLHLALPDDYALARATLERWLRYVVVGGLVVFDDFTWRHVPARLSMELPRWLRWRGAAVNQAIYVKCDEPPVPRP
jgi:predicted O-methyltransferase YrrM